jgi:hypothetical protein
VRGQGKVVGPKDEVRVLQHIRGAQVHYDVRWDDAEERAVPKKLLATVTTPITFRACIL